MRTVAAYLFGQVLLWRARLIFTVALVGDFVATHAVWVSPRNRQEVTKKRWRAYPPTNSLTAVAAAALGRSMPPPPPRWHSVCPIFRDSINGGTSSSSGATGATPRCALRGWSEPLSAQAAAVVRGAVARGDARFRTAAGRNLGSLPPPDRRPRRRPPALPP